MVGFEANEPGARQCRESEDLRLDGADLAAVEADRLGYFCVLFSPVVTLDQMAWNPSSGMDVPPLTPPAKLDEYAKKAAKQLIDKMTVGAPHLSPSSSAVVTKSLTALRSHLSECTKPNPSLTAPCASRSPQVGIRVAHF